MNHRSLAVVCLLLIASPALAQKEALFQSIRQRGDASWQQAQKIWGWAEVGYQEKRSATLLADVLEKAGFQVERGVAKIPTAFVAKIGSGSPVIGIMGEYDALPGLSQDALPFRKIREETTSGHGCGHHLFGVAAASAAIALGEQIQAGKMKGTLLFYGCPAEEGGSARAFMVREGLFKPCDVVLHWHPGASNRAGEKSNLARIAVKFRFHGQSAHAAGAPEKGRSAVGAVALTAHASHILREHTPDRTRLHHVVSDGGGAPNVVPDFAEVFFYVRHPEASMCKQIYERLVKCAQGAAIATETKLEIVYLGGTVQIVPNDALASVLRKQLKEQNDLSYDANEMKFALRLRESLPGTLPAIESIRDVLDGPGGDGNGSTDVSDVSWVAPTGGFGTACWVPGTPGHSWQATAAGGMSIGRKGMDLAARTLAGAAWDLFHDPDLITAAKAEFRARLTHREYVPLIGKDQPPPLDYRNPGRNLAP